MLGAVEESIQEREQNIRRDMEDDLEQTKTNVHGLRKQESKQRHAIEKTGVDAAARI